MRKKAWMSSVTGTHRRCNHSFLCHSPLAVNVMSTERDSQKVLVLLVEDEVLLRMAAALFLEDAGFEVLEAGNADEAIATLEGRDDVRFVFTDIDMPVGSMNGLKLAHTVWNRWPPIRIIIVSGHQAPADVELPQGSRFFAKPYDEAKMVASMLEMLAAA